MQSLRIGTSEASTGFTVSDVAAAPTVQREKDPYVESFFSLSTVSLAEQSSPSIIKLLCMLKNAGYVFGNEKVVFDSSGQYWPLLQPRKIVTEFFGLVIGKRGSKEVGPRSLLEYLQLLEEQAKMITQIPLLVRGRISSNTLENRDSANAEDDRFDFKKTRPLSSIRAVFLESKVGEEAKAKTDSLTRLDIYNPVNTPFGELICSPVMTKDEGSSITPTPSQRISPCDFAPSTKSNGVSDTMVRIPVYRPYE